MESIQVNLHSTDQINAIQADLKDLGSKIELLLNRSSPSNPDDLFTRKEAQRKLKVSRATMHRWDKEGIIKRTQIGSRVYYRGADIEAALTELK
ncbi:helix-turn-helix domain-containing protein [Leeuwenhoekiella blandensis]|uniref:helix-turn-helix domain-containing protein n=1 Tax=Leeuwenhoekiella blandensis TaxID=360293 RepID=UPI002357CAC7|nr:helix-turn-helix domain-containing protein [Leeuwenhoekiella blandensis]|tara:strand:- start:2431 stop:2712 length:282 start_codon:yes stop_codon:yes gene_type:complete